MSERRPRVAVVLCSSFLLAVALVWITGYLRRFSVSYYMDNGNVLDVGVGRGELWASWEHTSEVFDPGWTFYFCDYEGADFEAFHPFWFNITRYFGKEDIASAPLWFVALFPCFGIWWIVRRRKEVAGFSVVMLKKDVI